MEERYQKILQDRGLTPQTVRWGDMEDLRAEARTQVLRERQKRV